MGIVPSVGAGTHRTRLWRESVHTIPVLQANIDAIATEMLVFDYRNRLLTNQAADSNVDNALNIYTDLRLVQLRF